MEVYKGLKSSPGVAVGPVARIDRGAAGLHRIVTDPARERALYEAAIVLAKDELRRLQQRAQGPEADIFVFQIALLEDESFTNEIGDYIAAGAGSAVAVERAEQIFAARLDNVDDAYIRERSVDVRDACRRVVDILDGRPRQKLQLSTPSILAAGVFYPSDILSVERSMILGIASDADSDTSHAIILARTMGIPAVCRLGKGMADAADGRAAVLDATAGTLTLDPTAAVLDAALQKTRELARRARRRSAVAARPSVTRDGTPFTLLASSVAPEDIRQALAEGAAGIGLVRSEPLLARELNEDIQYRHYVGCLEAAAGAQLTVRTFDIGDLSGSGDAQETFGLSARGVRIMDEHRALFDQQICALLRAGRSGSLRVVFPMVGGPEDWDACMREVERCKEQLRRRKVPFREDLPFGCLVEIPAAALSIPEIVEGGAQFLVVGTNDLAQYSCAASRTGTENRYYRPDCLGVRRLVEIVRRAAAERGVTLTLVGSAAELPRVAEQYLRSGITRFSVELSSLRGLKTHLMGVDLREPPAPPKTAAR